MGLDEVRDEIIQIAQDSKAKIDAETKQRIKEIEAQAKDEIDSIRQKRQLEISRMSKQIDEIKSAQGHGEASGLLLEKKQEIIDGLIIEAKVELKKGNKKYIKQLLAKAQDGKAQDGFVVGAVYTDKDCVSMISGFGAKAAEIDGGIIVENKEGSISIDYSYSSILNSIKEKNLKEIIDVLLA